MLLVPQFSPFVEFKYIYSSNEKSSYFLLTPEPLSVKYIIRDKTALTYTFKNLFSLSSTHVKCISPFSSSKFTLPAEEPLEAEDGIVLNISANKPLNGFISAVLASSIIVV